jgi:CheY-like chemotaxis protein
MPATGILLSDDLFFTSRIAGTARALGLELHTVRTAAALAAAAKERTPACVLVDLHHPELNLATLAPLLKQSTPCTIVGYGSHVAAEVLHQARVAGCDVVLPRSKFVETLEDEMPKWFG